MKVPFAAIETVFLDRDGVINEKLPEGEFVRSWADFHILSGVPEAIARLNHAHMRVIVVSNQSGISRGLYRADDVLEVHDKLQAILAHYEAHIDGFYFCPHGSRQCNCRKPLPGLYEQACAEFHSIAPASSVMIGDSLPDIEFGKRLGMRTIFIDGNPERQKPGAESAAALAHRRFHSLAQAADFLLTTRGWS